MSDIESRVDSLRELAADLEGQELVPGLALTAPVFTRAWSITDVLALEAEVGDLPREFIEFILKVGGITAIDIADGVAVFTPKQVLDHLGQTYGHLLANVGGRASFPFAADGAGSYIVLGNDNMGVWRFSVHMSPIAKPVRIASSFGDFLSLLARDWRAFLES